MEKGYCTKCKKDTENKRTGRAKFICNGCNKDNSLSVVFQSLRGKEL